MNIELWPNLGSGVKRTRCSESIKRDTRVASELFSPWLSVRAAQDEMLREYKFEAANYLGRVNLHISETEDTWKQ